MSSPTPLPQANQHALWKTCSDTFFSAWGRSEMLKKTRLFPTLTSKWCFSSFLIDFLLCRSVSYFLSFSKFLCRNLLLEFHSSLSDKKKRPVVILVDGLDLVHDGTGQPNSDWIPQQLPQVGVHQKRRESKSVVHLLQPGSLQTQMTYFQFIKIVLIIFHSRGYILMLFSLSGCLFGHEHHIQCSTVADHDQEKKYHPVSPGSAHCGRPEGHSYGRIGHLWEET